MWRDQELQAIKLLADLSEVDRRRVGAWFGRRALKAGEMLVAFGEAPSNVYVLLEGSLQVIVESPDGRAVIYRDFSKGDVIGDFGAIDYQHRSANVYAGTDATLAVISDAGFRRLLEEYPAAAMAEMRHLVGVLRNLTKKIYSLSTQAAMDRLKAELLRLAESDSERPHVRMVSPIPTQTELAARIGSHREAVSRHLCQLEKSRLILRERGRLLIPDVRRLTTGDPLSGDN